MRAAAVGSEQMAPASGGRLTFIALSFAHMLRAGTTWSLPPRLIAGRGPADVLDGGSEPQLRPRTGPWERALTTPTCPMEGGGEATTCVFPILTVGYRKELSPILQLKDKFEKELARTRTPVR
jgi:hypothetical protein